MLEKWDSRDQKYCCMHICKINLSLTHFFSLSLERQKSCKDSERAHYAQQTMGALYLSMSCNMPLKKTRRVLNSELQSQVYLKPQHSIKRHRKSLHCTSAPFTVISQRYNVPSTVCAFTKYYSILQSEDGSYPHLCGLGTGSTARNKSLMPLITNFFIQSAPTKTLH